MKLQLTRHTQDLSRISMLRRSLSGEAQHWESLQLSRVLVQGP